MKVIGEIDYGHIIDTNTIYSAGTALDLNTPTNYNSSATIFNIDLSELSTSTSNGDGDYFIVTDTANAQYKLTKANVALSGFNNDSGWTNNTGTVTNSSTDTFTNKTIDANGTGNSISNIDTGNMTAAVVVTESETIVSNDNDTTLPTSAAVKDYADKRSIRVYGNTIKILPSDFMANEDAGATKTVQFSDSGTTGLKPGAATLELWAFTDIPEGKTATHIDVYAASNHTIGAYEIDINASGIGTAKGAGTANTQLDITDVDSTATNYLGIYVATGGTSNRIYGALVTIADI